MPGMFFLLMALTVALLASAGCGGNAVVPSSYSTYTDSNNFFTIQAPDGWDSKDGGDRKHGWIEYSSGTAKIAVDASPISDLIFSIAETGVVPMVGPGLDPSKAAKKVHWLEKPGFEENQDVKEERATPVQTRAGKGLQSEFTGENAFGTALHGYRATAVVNDKRVQIICQCPETEWNTLKPVFDTVIASVGP
ncbi:MAG: hypothetical protein JXB10_03170 [Pirellulales bacterium]|nr:hypothetical protein [Pirellulales bacterium]